MLRFASTAPFGLAALPSAAAADFWVRLVAGNCSSLPDIFAPGGYVSQVAWDDRYVVRVSVNRTALAAFCDHLRRLRSARRPRSGRGPRRRARCQRARLPDHPRCRLFLCNTIVHRAVHGDGGGRAGRPGAAADVGAYVDLDLNALVRQERCGALQVASLLPAPTTCLANAARLAGAKVLDVPVVSVGGVGTDVTIAERAALTQPDDAVDGFVAALYGGRCGELGKYRAPDFGFSLPPLSLRSLDQATKDCFSAAASIVSAFSPLFRHAGGGLRLLAGPVAYTVTDPTTSRPCSVMLPQTLTFNAAEASIHRATPYLDVGAGLQLPRALPHCLLIPTSPAMLKGIIKNGGLM